MQQAKTTDSRQAHQGLQVFGFQVFGFYRFTGFGGTAAAAAQQQRTADKAHQMFKVAGLQQVSRYSRQRTLVYRIH
jgi:hypothetical protein